MVTDFQPKSIPWHRLTRFVSKKAIALLLKIKPEDIKDIHRWANVLLVVGPHISRFVSYADLPVIPAVALPSARDILYWRKRWGKIAPKFWAEFYTQQYQQAETLEELTTWNQIVKTLEKFLPQKAAEKLQTLYLREEFCREYF